MKRLKPFCYWYFKLGDLAEKEGWILTDYTDEYGDCYVDIRKLDESSRFNSDDEAETFVIQQALAGSKVHMLAMWLVGRDSSKQVSRPIPTALRNL